MKGNEKHSNSIIFRFWKYLRPYKYSFIYCNLLAPLRAFISVFYGILVQKIIDSAVSQDRESFYLYIHVIVITILTDLVFSTTSNYNINKYRILMQKDIKEKIAYHVHKLEISSFEKASGGDIISKMNNDIPQITKFASSIPNYTYQPIVFLAAFTYMLLTNWKLLMVSVAL